MEVFRLVTSERGSKGFANAYGVRNRVVFSKPGVEATPGWN
jgi:hypothetical protein